MMPDDFANPPRSAAMYQHTGELSESRYCATIGSDRPCNHRAASVSRNVIRISSTLYADALPEARLRSCCNTSTEMVRLLSVNNSTVATNSPMAVMAASGSVTHRGTWQQISHVSAMKQALTWLYTDLRTRQSRGVTIRQLALISRSASR